ncbi:MAG: hypothetical protein EOO27_03290 [Comamonadaceae bacterium]|nr:MAG: hypothetical protein EOO27_03290 [Comamonadaceae bacterium]
MRIDGRRARYALGAHVAPLGMTFTNARGMPPELANGMFIGEHGSWIRKPHAGLNGARPSQARPR